MLHHPVFSRSLWAIALVLSAALAAVAASAPDADAAPSTLYVAPTGSDADRGTAHAPLRTIQRALDRAVPGTTIVLASGVYRESVTTKVAGTAAAPITVRGPESGKDPAGRYRAVLASPGGRAFSVDHSHYVLDGFTIDGQPAVDRSEYPRTLAEVRGFKDAVQDRVVDSRLVYVGAADTTSDLTDVTVSDMFLTGAGGECVRFRNRTTDSAVVDSVIQWCGLRGKGDDRVRYRYHNGEGVYIGTSPKSTDQPFAKADTTHGIVVRDSTVHTFGSECFDVKENAHDNLLEDSDCGFDDEPRSFDGSNIELRGDHNLVRGDTVGPSRGGGVKLVADDPSYDRGGNSVQLSSFTDAAAPAIRSQRSGSMFCGNTFTQAPVSEGPGDVGDPTRPCPDPRPARSVVVEAESGAVTAPMGVRADRTAQGGRYVTQAGGSAVGRDAVVLTVPGGWYTPALRVVAPDPSSDSFTVAVDGGTPTTWNLGTHVAWTWVTGPALRLGAGRHTVVVARRESGARLDAVRLSPVD